MRKLPIIIISNVISILGTALSTSNFQNTPSPSIKHTPIKCAGDEGNTSPLKPSLSVKDGYIYEGGLRQLRRNANTAQRMLNDFILAVRSFVFNTIFDYQGFLNFRSALESQISNICALVGPHTEWKPEFEGQIAFAKYLLRTYGESAIIMEFYPLENGQAQKLIFKLTQLNVKLLSLFDSHGIPDRKLEGYNATVMRSAVLLASWGGTFLSLGDQPLSILVAFQAQFAKAKQNLITLSANSSFERVIKADDSGM